MPRSTPLVSRALGAAAAALVIAAAVAVAVHHNKRSTVASTTATSGTTVLGGPGTSVPASVGSTPTSPASPVTRTGPATSGSPPTASGPTTTGAPTVVPVAGSAGDPGKVQPTSPGSYAYTETINGDSRPLTEAVSNQGSSGGQLNQSLVDSSTDANGKPTTVRRDQYWQADGLYVRSTDFAFGGYTVSCHFATPVHELVLPVAVGKQWQVKGTCPVTVAGAPDTLTFTGTVKVTGVARVAVAGQAVNVWVLASSLDVTGTGAIPFTAHQDGTVQLDAAEGQQVTEATKTVVKVGTSTMTGDESRQLKALRPS